MRVLLLSALLSTLALAGCLSGDDSPDDAGTPQAPAADAPLTAWLHDLSEPVEDLPTVTEQYRTVVPGPAGDVELDTWIIRPDVDEPVPVVLEVTPYYTGGQPAALGRVAEELIPRGYAVGVSSVRGTGNSGGCFTQAGPEEAKDTAAVIEHIAGQDWANGNVGLIGVSYPGTTPQDVWVEAPPSLKTIVPISGISDMYRYNFVNGVHISPQGAAFNTYYWVLVGAVPPSTDDIPTVPGAIAGELCPDQVEVQEGGASSGVDSNKDAYWQVRDFGAEYRADDRDVERASVWYIHGLQDWNVKPHNMEGWLDTLWASGVPMKVWLGQWAHAWPASTNPDNPCEYDVDADEGAACRADWWNQTLVAWFDRFLKGKDTGILDAPAVQVQDDDGVWRHEERWPPQDMETLTFHLTSDQALAGDADSGTLSYTVGPLQDLPVGTSRLTFVSAPLEEDLHVSGLPVFEGTVTAAGNRANLILSLGQQTESGAVSYVNFAAQSLNHVEDEASGAMSVAGTPLEVNLPFFPQDDVLHAGNRVVLTFASNTVGAPGPALDPVQDPGTISLDLATATLTLPIDGSVTPESLQPYANLPLNGDEDASAGSDA